jgi:phage replication-related protein YjqB (UPF0714/DUF867 family)
MSVLLVSLLWGDIKNGRASRMSRAPLVGGQNPHKLCTLTKSDTARGVKYWADILRRLASSGMKNGENEGKRGSWIQGEMSSSTSAVGGETPCISALGKRG